MADANRTRLSVNGISFIEKSPVEKDGTIRDDEIAYEKLVDFDCFTGTGTALISAGIIEEHMLPGQPDRGEKTSVIDGGDSEKWAAGYIEITRKDGRLFEVKAGVSRMENDRRQQAQRRLLQAEQAAKKLEAAQQREALELSELPRTHQQYRENCVKTLRAHLNIVRDTAIAANKFSGFHFDSDALRAFDKAAIELLKTLYRGGTVFDPATQERRIVDIRSQSSKVNMPLQNFLQSVTARTDGEEEPTN
jgi:hypothetical protein